MPNCQTCGHPLELHLIDFDQCQHRTRDDFRCVCDHYEEGQ